MSKDAVPRGVALGAVALGIVLLLTSACTSSPIPTSTLSRPQYRQDEAIEKVLDHLQSEFGFDLFWAQPRFPLDRWCASYQGAGAWHVKVYDVDKSYAGTWLLSEVDGTVVPNDDKAKAVTQAKGLARMPARPPFARPPPDTPDELMIQAVQLYIAQLPAEKASQDVSVAEFRKLVRNYYPLKWYVSYDSSYWVVAATHFEYKVVAYIEPSTGAVKYLFDEYSWQDALWLKPPPGSKCESP
ncbi:MAG: hypothetical protein Q8P22_12160 [Chloroflexota bacterium]|nr:hypothetical protein [Chloroflexota bacterium]